MSVFLLVTGIASPSPPISEVQTLKFERDELYRNFEVHTGQLEKSKTSTIRLLSLMRARKRHGPILQSTGMLLGERKRGDSKYNNLTT
jgi:hypothetical protein